MFVRNGRKLNYLLESGLEPYYIEPSGCHFRKSKKLFELLERYTIIYDCFPNRL